MKKEVMEELCTVRATNPKVIDRITYLIRGDFPEYIKCLKDELKEAHETNAKLQERIKQIEKEALYNQIILQRVTMELNKCKLLSNAPSVNRLK